MSYYCLCCKLLNQDDLIFVTLSQSLENYFKFVEWAVITSLRFLLVDTWLLKTCYCLLTVSKLHFMTKKPETEFALCIRAATAVKWCFPIAYNLHILIRNLEWRMSVLKPSTGHKKQFLNRSVLNNSFHFLLNFWTTTFHIGKKELCHFQECSHNCSATTRAHDSTI